jgi:hypothetical protein
MAINYTSTAGIFRPVGEQIVWFTQLNTWKAGDAFSSGGAQFRSIQNMRARIRGDMEQGVPLARQYTRTAQILAQQEDLLDSMQDAAAAKIRETFTNHVRDQLGVSETDPRALALLLAAQMSADSQAVRKNSVTVSAVSALGSNVGNAQVYLNIKDLSAVTNELVLRDNFTLKALDDAPNSGVTVGQEILEVTSETAPGNRTLLQVIDEEGTGFLSRLTNGGFETETSTGSAKPKNWDLDTGSANITLTSTSANVYLGSLALQFSGDGATATHKISQSVGSNLTTRLENDIYSVGFWAKGDWTTGAATAHCSLVGTGYTTGSAEKVSFSTPPSSFSHKHFFVAVPRDQPNDLELVIRVTGTLASAKHLWIDNIKLAKVPQHENVGIAVHRGSAPVTAGPSPDQWNWSTDNDRAGTFQTFFTENRTSRKGIDFRVRLPSTASGSETIPDSYAK